MQFVLLIYQGTTPLPNTDAWEALSADEQKAIYADYAALNKDSRVTGGPPAWSKFLIEFSTRASS